MKRRSLRVNWLTKGMMKTNNHAFGHDYEHLFGVGDLVSWHILGKDENIGLIMRIFKKKMGNRHVLVAKLNSVTDKSYYEVLLSSLSVLSSVKKHEVF